MNHEPPTVSPGAGHGGGSWARPLALVASCLVIGFVGGWILRGDEGPVTVLAPVAPIDSGDAGSVTTGTTTAPSPTPDTAPAAPVPPPDRADIALAVLNGTGVSGLAAQTAAQAESLGYRGVATGNAAPAIGPSIAYFAPGRRAAARRVARDLLVGPVEPLPRGGAGFSEAPEGADVVLVLGPG